MLKDWKVLIKILPAMVVWCLLLVSAQPQTSSYQPVEPKMDTTADNNKTSQGNAVKNSPKVNKPPLAGKVQKNDNVGLSRGQKRFGAQGDRDPLRAGLNDRSLNAKVQGSIGIIGVKFLAVSGKPPVINEIFPGTPAHEAGLMLADYIIAVDGVPTAGLTKDEVFDLIVGTPGTPVTLSIMRNGNYRVVTCTRMDINELNDPRVRRDYLMHI